jgi:hypothetical protein
MDMDDRAKSSLYRYECGKTGSCRRILVTHREQIYRLAGKSKKWYIRRVDAFEKELDDELFYK